MNLRQSFLHDPRWPFVPHWHRFWLRVFFGCTLALGCATSLAACCGSGGSESSAKAEKDSAATDGGAAPESDASPHKVVYADRTSQGYLMLLEGGKAPKAPSRDDLLKLAKARFKRKLERREFDGMLALIATEPHETPLAARHSAAMDAGSETEGEAYPELLGLHIAMLENSEGDQALIPPIALRDPILVRGLDENARASLPARKWALLLRADYRSVDRFLGLRLLQLLVGEVARDRNALIYDPDTLETRTPDVFSRLAFRGDDFNVIDQIAVVPFTDISGGETRIRLTTRGMRRFGVVDLELDGLVRDAHVLQRASDLIYGLARVLAADARVDSTGLAVEVDQRIRLTRAHVIAAYQPGRMPVDCGGCAGEVDLHLVERDAKESDAIDHAVARIVAPRPQSEPAGYDHQAWVRSALELLFGPPS